VQYSYQAFLKRYDVVKMITLDRTRLRSRTEIYTPLSLVKEMHDKLPVDFWKSPTNIIADPGVKSGVFLFDAVERFMVGLEPLESNEDARFTYIVKNQIWGFCCSPWAYASVSRVLFGEIESEEHIYNQSFLDSKGKIHKNVLKILKKNKRMNFDAIVGNPPYQELGNSGKSIAGAGRKLWIRFVEASIETLKPNGYLSVVHPSGWRSILNPMWSNIYQRWQVSDVVLEPMIKWSAGVKVDHYLLQRTPYVNPTTVTHNGKSRVVDFREVDGLVLFPFVERILKSDGDRLKVDRTQSHHVSNGRKDGTISESKTSKFCYPIKDSGSKDVLWATFPHNWASKKKVIMSRTGYLDPIFDDGVCGTSDGSYAIFVSSKTEADYIIRLLNSKLYRFIQSNTKNSGFNDLKILNRLPYPKSLPASFTDADLYKHFQLADAEIKTIEDTIKD